MIRIVLIASLATACSSPSKADTPKPEVTKADPKAADGKPAESPPTPNAVCEEFKGVNGTAKCEPHHTDVGELHIHTATVTLGQQRFACRTDLSMLGVLCGDPIVVKQQPPPPTQDAPAAKKPEPKKK